MSDVMTDEEGARLIGERAEIASLLRAIPGARLYGWNDINHFSAYVGGMVYEFGPPHVALLRRVRELEAEATS